jgi:hypothetical protein
MASIGFLETIVFSIFYQEFLLMLAWLGAVLLVWLPTSRMPSWRYRILLRALTMSFCLTPFVPHGSVEWYSPWPPAGYWIVNGLRKGHIEGFELMVVIAVGIVVWLAGMAVHQARRRGPEPMRTLTLARNVSCADEREDDRTVASE